MKQPISSAHRKYVRFFDALRQKNCNFVFLTQKLTKKQMNNPLPPARHTAIVQRFETERSP